MTRLALQNNRGQRTKRFLAIFAAFAFAMGANRARAAVMELIEVKSVALQENPLRDPATRLAAVFLPSQASNTPHLPIVYYLPGFGGSSLGFMQASNAWMIFTQSVSDNVTPVIFVAIDAKTRLGGSQYLNSPAQGNYEDYICDELLPAVERRHSPPASGIRRVVAGHSSGGFGALRLGMDRHNLFDAVMALSPDSDFPTSHLPLVKIPSVAKVTPEQANQFAYGSGPLPKDGDVVYAIALSAAYAPDGLTGKFDWLYDAQGTFREDVWRRWLENDPLTIAREKPLAFAASQCVYLEGAAKDEYSANVGARKIFETIQDRGARCVFYEPPGHHSDHVQARIQRGLEWVFSKPLSDIK